MSEAPVRGESRLPMALAVIVLMVFALVSPAHLTFFPGWLLATVVGVLLVVLLIGDPGRIDRDTPVVALDVGRASSPSCSRARSARRCSSSWTCSTTRR